MKKEYLLAVVGIIIVVAVLFITRVPTSSVGLGGVSIANEYHSTTTLSTLSDPHLLKTGPGALGSIIVAEVDTAGAYTCFNATTTDPALRHAKYATSTITLAVVESTTRSRDIYLRLNLHSWSNL